jgi:hypothetical protein
MRHLVASANFEYKRGMSLKCTELTFEVNGGKSERVIFSLP